MSLNLSVEDIFSGKKDIFSGRNTKKLKSFFKERWQRKMVTSWHFLKKGFDLVRCGSPAANMEQLFLEQLLI